MNFKKTVLSAVIAVMAAPGHAGFVDNRTPAPKKVEEKQVSGDPASVSNLPLVFPKSASWNSRIKGFGKDQSPADALKQVVPTGVTIMYEDGLMEGKRVSWHGNNTRKVVVEKILADAQLSGHFEAEGKELVLERRAAALPALASAAVADAPVATVPQAKVWDVQINDENFRLLLSRWSKSGGWNLVWDYDKDIPITATDNFSGEFKTAVSRVLSATELTEDALKPCFYTNQVVRVVRKMTKCDPTDY